MRNTVILLVLVYKLTIFMTYYDISIVVILKLLQNTRLTLIIAVVTKPDFVVQPFLHFRSTLRIRPLDVVSDRW